MSLLPFLLPTRHTRRGSHDLTLGTLFLFTSQNALNGHSMAPAQPAAKLEREKRLKSILGKCSAPANTHGTNPSPQLSAQASPNDSRIIATRRSRTTSSVRFVAYRSSHLLLSPQDRMSSTSWAPSSGTSQHGCDVKSRAPMARQRRKRRTRTKLFACCASSHSWCSILLQPTRRAVHARAASD